jgi:hypothetical protein
LTNLTPLPIKLERFGSFIDKVLLCLAAELASKREATKVEVAARFKQLFDSPIRKYLGADFQTIVGDCTADMVLQTMQLLDDKAELKKRLLACVETAGEDQPSHTRFVNQGKRKRYGDSGSSAVDIFDTGDSSSLADCWEQSLLSEDAASSALRAEIQGMTAGLDGAERVLTDIVCEATASGGKS